MLRLFGLLTPALDGYTGMEAAPGTRAWPVLRCRGSRAHIVPHYRGWTPSCCRSRCGRSYMCRVAASASSTRRRWLPGWLVALCFPPDPGAEVERNTLILLEE